MRQARLYAHDLKGVMPRMSWSPHNLYNLIARATPMHASGATFKKSRMTMYQQRWRSKRLLRGYHGDWIRERTFKRWYLPLDLPRLKNTMQSSKMQEASSEETMPITSLFFRDVERRLDTVVFRCCFARSAREARAMVIHGKVYHNGQRVTTPGLLLQPGDLISVEPEAVPMLGKVLQKQAEMRAAAKMANGAQVEREGENDAVETETAEKASAPEAEAKASATTEADEEAAGSSTATEDAESHLSSEAEEPRASSAPEAQRKGREELNKAVKVVEQLPPGVYPFNLPPYATPFLFVPPFLEVSFTTCSAIYVRHPTITPSKPAEPSVRRPNTSRSTPAILFKTDLPSPYPAGGDIFSLAWEHYAKNAPRTRSNLRRLKMEAKVGRNGFQTARAKDEWRKVKAVRRGHDSKVKLSPPKPHEPTEFVVGSIANRRRTGRTVRSIRFVESERSEGDRPSAQF